MNTPPCAGRWELFDSIDHADHRRARALCGICPMRATCLAELEAATEASHCGIKYGPRGTWAGLLVGLPRMSVQRARAEEEMFTEADARQAHARYAAGIRDDRTVIGERVYNRRKKRTRRNDRSAA